MVAEARELMRFVEEKLDLHKAILASVKTYVDGLLRESFGIDPERLRSDDPSTYYAITMELARSIMISWENEQRRKAWRRG